MKITIILLPIATYFQELQKELSINNNNALFFKKYVAMFQ